MENKGIELNGMIAGFNHSGCYSESVLTFRKFHSRGLKPNGIGISSFLPAVGDLEDFILGSQIHGDVVNMGMESDKCVSAPLWICMAKAVVVWGTNRAFSYNLIFQTQVSVPTKPMDSIAAASGQTSRPYLTAFSIFVLSCFLVIILQVFSFSPITPEPLELPPASSASFFPQTANYSLIVFDAEKVLLEFGEDGVTFLASHVNNTKIRFADDVIEAPDGRLYFSIASTKFGLHDWYFDVLQAKPHGQVIKFDPLLNETSIVLGGLCFANGIALSVDQDYLVVCEYWKQFYLISCHFCLLVKGRAEIFVDNLPGGPDNIKLVPDGSFFIALLQLTSGGLECGHNSKALKHLVETFPKLLERVKGMHTKATVVNVATNGKIIRSFNDPHGDVMSFVTSALEFEDHIYLGSLNSNFIGKLPLNGANYSSTNEKRKNNTKYE
ncbi:hypothetical protein RHSIM_Rhsim05G0006100 [Rhododendron simsii]|uniref:Strictosidine synthase conserved region domain-containing protein n=1 Tax=Rhododendron simsii TaxID=118357 RepID=A0A834GVU4_RHOSS|nr:hypothetical protein RHSIM_Rhsim05G0006100 [Rhododendron simsii]